MNRSKAIFLVNLNARAIVATYHEDDDPSGRTRAGGPAVRKMFKTLDGSIKVGDLVVVPTETRHKATVCKVVEVDVDPQMDDPTPINWVIDRVRVEEHDALVAKEKETVDTIARIEFNKKRNELRESMLGDAEALKALPLYDTTVPGSTGGGAS